MEQITIGQVASVLAIVVSLVGSIGYLRKHLSDWIHGAIQPDLDGIKNDIKEVKDRLDDVDMESCKNYIVSELIKVEQGGWWSDIERMRFYEQYEHYKNIGGNTYIQQWYEELQKQGKL